MHGTPNPHNPALVEARVVAQRDAEALGWSRWLAEEVDEALEMVLSTHAPGDRVRYSDLVLVDQRGANVGHTANVLQQIGLLLDDRPDTSQALAGHQARIGGRWHRHRYPGLE